MSYPNQELVDKLVHDAHVAAGFVYETESGDERIDDELVKDAVYQEMVEHHVVKDRRQMQKIAVARHELYAAIFPKGPEVSRPAKTQEEHEAHLNLQGKVWNLTNTGPTGAVNRRVGDEGLTLVMCEASVARTYIDEESGRKKPTTERARFLTDNAELIAAHSTAPRAAKLVKVAEAVAKHMLMVLGRHPELAEPVTRQITGAVTKSRATLEGAVTKPLVGSRADVEVA